MTIDIPRDILDIAERLRTQDNRITADPIFVVQEEKRVYGMDASYSDNIAWLHADECHEVDAKLARRLEKLFWDSCEPKTQKRIDERYTRTGYFDEWVNVQPFFTEDAADAYCDTQKHRHKGKLRVFADSAYRNPEWRAVRKFLLSLTEPG